MKKTEMLISIEIGWVKYLGEFYVTFFLFRLTAYSLRKPLQNNNKNRCAFKFLRMDSSKGIPFCGLDVAVNKGYFCSVQQTAEVGARSLVE